MSWRDAAACRGVDPDLFFPERGEPTNAAKEVCAGCPVSDECLEFALSTVERHGIWGGMSERQRREHRGDGSEGRACARCGERTQSNRHLYCGPCAVVQGALAGQRAQVSSDTGACCVRCGLTLLGGRSLGSGGLCGGWACERAARLERQAELLGEAS